MSCLVLWIKLRIEDSLPFPLYTTAIFGGEELLLVCLMVIHFAATTISSILYNYKLSIFEVACYNVFKKVK